MVYGYMFWVAIGLLFSAQERGGADYPGLRRFSHIISALLFVTVLSGGFVAGLKAGMAYNTFPLMAGQLIPDGILNLQPVWRNFFENVTTVQFDHRLLATIIFLLISLFWWIARKEDLPSRINVAVHILLLFMIIQVSLGISTLLLYVPTSLAATHQGGAMALFTVALFLSKQLSLGVPQRS